MGIYDALQVGASLAGAWYDNRQDTKMMRESMRFNQAEAATSRQFQAEQANIDRQLQREFAENGIRMRVDDAVRAGLHPLVGAGAQPLNYSPVSVGSSQASSGYHQSNMGQNIARAINAVKSKEEREADQLRLQLLRSQIGETDARAGYYSSIANRAAQEANGSAAFPTGAGRVKISPDEKISQATDDPSRTAGSDHPFFKRYEFIPGLSIDVPYSQEGPAEGMEGLGALTAVLGRNLLYRPGKWAYRVMKKTFGEQPYKKYNDGLVSGPSTRR